MVVNTSGLLAEELCLALTSPGGRVVTTLVQPPGLRWGSCLRKSIARGVRCVVSAAALNFMSQGHDIQITEKVSLKCSQKTEGSFPDVRGLSGRPQGVRAGLGPGGGGPGRRRGPAQG